MNKKAPFKFIFKDLRSLIIFSMVFIALMQIIMILFITTINPQPIISAILSQLPQKFGSFITQQFITQFTIRGAAAFGFNHPMVLAVMAIVAIILPSRHLAGEIETGTMELLLSYPVKRSAFIISVWLAGSSVLLLIILSGGLASIAGLVYYHEINGELFQSITRIVINLWFFFILIMTGSLLFSAFEKEGSKAGMRMAATLLIFYFWHFLTSLWKAVESTDRFNIFHYYQPHKIMMGEQQVWVNLIVLIILTVFCFLAAVWHFKRRDIPG
jgi:ABC-type transport system involved in multi-copper enzyme maturation permease subunit